MKGEQEESRDWHGEEKGWRSELRIGCDDEGEGRRTETTELRAACSGKRMCGNAKG